ncbi:MAG: KamA family radical SAM protein [Chlamydiales bacterium]
MPWKQVQKNNFTSIERLAEFLELSEMNRSILIKRKDFPLNIPLRLAKKMQKNSLLDPLFKQYVSTSSELLADKGYSDDPVQDKQFCKTPKLLQKYRGRALLICTQACAMHCRFCFRQNFPYASLQSKFDREIAYITEDQTITEVILSGGDPLSLSDHYLRDLCHRLAAIPHVQIIRFHTRFLIGIPERITDSLLSSLPENIQMYFVIHINHPLELDADVIDACRSLQGHRIQLLSQTVLLKGINDSVAPLQELFFKLAGTGIIPYYFHQLDAILGGGHFFVEKEKGIHLIKELQKCLPGYAVPKYVEEIPGQFNKTRIF